MKIAIVYDSLTGNTKMVAEAIQEALKDEVVYCGEPKEVEADFYFIGSWTDKGNASKKIHDFCEILHGKKIALFQTCGAGKGESYYKDLCERFKSEFSSDNEVVDAFYCQGKMVMSLRDRFVKMLQENPADKDTQFRLEEFDEALKHPSLEDLENAKEFARKAIEK